MSFDLPPGKQFIFVDATTKLPPDQTVSAIAASDAIAAVASGAAAGKVDKVAGKGLSTEDYTTAEKSKLLGVATGATVNDSNSALRDRGTHTGSQGIGTITGLQSDLDAKAADIAARVTKGRDSINILDYGVVEGDVTSANDAANTTALQAAISAAASQRRKLIIPGGTYRFSGTLNVSGSACWEGAGRGRTTLKYTGSGTAIANSSPGTRRYEWSMSRFSLTTSTGQVGLDLDSVSTSEFSLLAVNGFTVANIDIHCTTNGYSVYNRFFNVTSSNSPIGFYNRGSGTNANVFAFCRGLMCSTYGIYIGDSNDCTVDSCQVEESGTAVYLTGATSGANDSHRIRSFRSEHNTTGIEIASANVRYTEITGYWFDSSTTNKIVTASGSTSKPRRAAGSMFMPSDTQIVCDPGVQFSSGGNINLGSTTAAIQADTASPMHIRSNVPDGSTAVGTWIGNAPTLTTPGAKIIAFSNGSPVAHATAVAYVRQDGGYEFASGPAVLAGAGSPEGAVTAPVGSVYLRSNGGAATTLYVKESGTSNTGWVATGSGGGGGSGGNPGAWVPADNELLACDVDPILSSTSFTLTAGVLYLRKIKMAVASAVSVVKLYVSTAGASLSNAYVGVFDAAGNQLATSADVSTALQSTGTKSISMTTPTASLPAGTAVYVGVLIGAGSTLSALRGFSQSIHAFGISSAANYRWASTGTGLTALPASFTPSGVASVSGVAPMVGLT